MRTLLYHPTGNANVRAAAAGLARAGHLHSFHTSIASFPGTATGLLSRVPGLSELNRRSFDPLLKPYTHQHPLVEVGRLLSLKGGLSGLTAHETGRFSVDAAYHYLDRRIASVLRNARQRGIDSVYAYEDGALAAFTEAKQQGVSCLYDLPIGYWRSARRLLEQERERWPEWASTLTGFRDSEAKLHRKDEELRLADRIFVASSFTASTLKEFPGSLPAAATIIPYGFPPTGPPRQYEPLKGRPLKLLFVGGLSQRKGLADLFAAADYLKEYVQLTVVGRKTSASCNALDEALAKHHWIPGLPHKDILQLMREHDVLVFPSLFEGFGLVITEAMSQGTPVITTNRTAGPDLIRHGENGWLTEAGSTASLQASIEYLLQHPEAIVKAGEEAIKTAALRPWEVYGQELAAALTRTH